MTLHMSVKIVENYGSLGTFTNVPQWAQNTIVTGAYQQGKAEAFEKAFDELLKRIAVR